MSAAKDWWSNLFDKSLDNVVVETDQFRNLTMIVHVLQLELKKVSSVFIALHHTIGEQSKEIQQLKQSTNRADYKIDFRSPLRAIPINELTPVKRRQDISVNFEEDADIFNHQISELDLINSSKENDSTLFIDDSFKDFEITNSPKLNKSKSRRHSRTIRAKSRLKMLENSIICNTPEVKEKKTKKYKQSKLSLTQLTGKSKPNKSATNRYNNKTQQSLKRNDNSTNRLSNEFQFPGEISIDNLNDTTFNNEVQYPGKITIGNQNGTNSFNNEAQISRIANKENPNSTNSLNNETCLAAIKPNNNELTFDETLYLGAKNSQEVDIEVILNHLEDETLPNKKSKTLLDNSFDRIPEKFSDDEDFVYKPEVVRKKAERLKLQGWSCHDCEKYYTKCNLDEDELRKKMDACSRHRSKFNPRILTPKGFWDCEFSPTQQ